MSDQDADLVYGEDYRRDRAYGSQGTERGLIGDTVRFLKGRYQGPQQPQQLGNTQPSSSSGQPYNPSQQYGYSQASYGGQSYGSGQQQPNQGRYNSLAAQNTIPQYPGGPPVQGQQPQKPDMVTNVFDKLHGAVYGIGSELASALGSHYEPQQHAGQSGDSAQAAAQYRYDSFASPKNGNDVKWYVDGCGYMYAVSKALEQARESIWILDWWLSPELYLRRPPSKHAQYRLDRMLQAAAQRGVRVNIIIYKEVTQALTRKYLSPTIPDYLHSLLPHSTDMFTSTLVRMGLLATAASMEYLEAEQPLIAPPVTVSSSHTKHALESLHPNIAVFRHPDHLPDAQSSLTSAFQNLKLNAATASKLGEDALKSLYGITDGVILYWAHHEKLCLIDGKIAFMGGLDLCFGRWDMNQHPIADAHPGDLEAIAFPGQDYNNARILDFQDVAHWENNKLDRKQSSRMGWSDISVGLQGPCVQDLRRHFVDRWNFIFDEKYNVRRDVRYSRLSLMDGPAGGQVSHGSQPFSNQQSGFQQQQQSLPSQTLSSNSQMHFPPPPGSGANLQPPYSYASDSTQQPSQSSSRPHSPQPTYQQQPSWQHSSRPHSPQPPHQQPQNDPYGASQHEQYYPPPPPGGPPPISSPLPSYESGQQANPYLYDSHAQSQHSFASELEGSAPGLNPPYDSQSSVHGYPPPPPQQSRAFDDDGYLEPNTGGERGFGGRSARYGQEGRRLKDELSGIGNMLYGQVGNRVQNVQGKVLGGKYGRPLTQPCGSMTSQIVRSCTKWSGGTPTEHSIQNAYISVIQNSHHFIYIENQFFITATGNSQRPIQNQIGKAIVERILRAARAGETYKVIVLIPSVPGFAGDLRDDSALGTRAIMEFQYNSINRGGHSIMETIGKAGYNPMDFIRFYNLRNYDRINASGTMSRIEQRSGVDYEVARKQHDDTVGAGFAGQGEGTNTSLYNLGPQYQQYQQAAEQASYNRPAGSSSTRWDSVSECYMLGGEDLRNVPWDYFGDLSEIDAFVSEELYIHSKVLIADDRVVICGSANLNDRSQLGTHDSEIAIVVEDPTPVQSTMAGRPWQASHFAASLRRQLFRKHLGLLRPQDMQRPHANFEPVGVPNDYDWGSPEDRIVADPLSDTFQSLWYSRARQNTEIFRQVFRAVPDDNVRTWADYKEFFEYFFHDADKEAEGKKDGSKVPGKYEWGHIVRDDFPPGPEGIRQVKELLCRVKGTLVEMPLMFLIEEDIAKEGLTLNALTEEVYT